MATRRVTPNSIGATVEQAPGKQSFTVTLPFPAHPKGEFVVISSGGASVPDDVLIDRAMRVILENTVEFSPDLETKTAWRKKLKQHKAAMRVQMAMRQAERREDEGTDADG